MEVLTVLLPAIIPEAALSHSFYRKRLRATAGAFHAAPLSGLNRCP
jgi:hypothetical protein